MPRPKKERGRPLEKPYPPRIDATPEQLAQAFFSGAAGHAKPFDARLPMRGLPS